MSTLEWSSLRYLIWAVKCHFSPSLRKISNAYSKTVIYDTRQYIKSHQCTHQKKYSMPTLGWKSMVHDNSLSLINVITKKIFSVHSRMIIFEIPDMSSEVSFFSLTKENIQSHSIFEHYPKLSLPSKSMVGKIRIFIFS